MHIAVVVENIPDPATGGGAITAWTLTKFLAGRKHWVTNVLILQRSTLDDPVAQMRMKALADLDVDVIPVTVDLPDTSGVPHNSDLPNRLVAAVHRTLQPTLENYYPWVSLAPKIEEILRGVQPDVILAYHWKATAATHGLNVAPRFAMLGDPEPLVHRFRAMIHGHETERTATRQPLYGRLLSKVTTFVNGRRHPARMMQLLSGCEAVGFFAAHHAEWVRKNGVPACLYLRTPVPDVTGPEWESLRSIGLPRHKPKILMIGHLKGTATLSGLYLFAEEILPLLEERLGPGGFEVHVVGDYALPPDLARLLAKPSVRLRGHVEPADQEFLSSDVLLVPTPIELGCRVRILVGWSFGCCVVAHEANAHGIPEMVHEKNALVASDGQGLADGIIRALRDSSTRRRLGVNGRRTYEQEFAPSVAGARIAAELERICADAI